MFRKIVKKDVLKSLSRHKDISTEFFEKIKSIEKVILENVGTDLAKKAVSMSREVDGDLHEHKAFLRLLMEIFMNIKHSCDYRFHHMEYYMQNLTR
jgi:hypothetical protein